MKILFLAPRMPMPADTGGKIRTLNILKQLAKTNDVDMLTFSFEAEDEAHGRDLKDFGIRSILVPASPVGLLKRLSLLFLTSVPYSVAKYQSILFAEKMRGLLEEQTYDLIHCDHIHMTHYLNLAKDIPTVIDEHNVEYRILERCGSVEKNMIKKILYVQQAQKMKRFETQKMKEADACCAVSEDDADLLKALGGRAKISVIPNGVDTEYFRTHDEQRTANDEHLSLVFTGSMDWMPNEDAVIHFCEDVLPLIWQKEPQVKFFVVGKAPSSQIRVLGSDERIVVTGCVDDVRPYMEQAGVFVVPIRIGGGTRLKILEAMSMEKALVSTSVGAEGIAYTPGAELVTADDAPGFAGAVLHLLNDQARRQSLGQEGRRLVLEKYDWSIVGQRLLEAYREVESE